MTSRARPPHHQVILNFILQVGHITARTTMPIFSETILASAMASLCLSAAVADPVGFCSGKSMGIYSVPGEPACTTKYYQCIHGPDATPGVRSAAAT